MYIGEREGLRSVKTLISSKHTCIELWQDCKSNLLVSAKSCEPKGTVYFITTALLLCRFLENKINLQTLCDETPSFIVEIVSDTKTAFYSTKDVEIKLCCGNQTSQQLLGTSPWEIW